MTKTSSSLHQALATGLQQQGQNIDPLQQDKLIQFVELLSKWNKVYNLTSIKKPYDMIHLHLLDSLVMLPFFDNPQSGSDSSIKQVLDVGTGGGIPGIPLAICLPDIHFVLMDARGKKIRFIQTVIAQLGLANVTAIHSRVEEFPGNTAQKNNIYSDPDKKFDRIISRAFASLSDMILFCQHLLSPQGKFLAMKGQIPQEEIAQLPEGYRIEQINELNVSGLEAKRHLIQIAFNANEEI